MYDVIILGGGPAGYVAAERAGELGKKALLIDSGEHGGGLGGVCLNSGCIPTKSMLFGAKTYDHAKHGAVFGVTAENVKFDYTVIKKRTEELQAKLGKGIEGLMKMNKVEVVRARGKIVGKNKVEADGKTYEGANLLICTGSRPMVPPIPGLRDNVNAITNEGILKLEKMAEHLCIIGAGVIGTEYASLYANVGKKVTVVEMLPKICGAVDKELAKTVQKKLEDRGVTFHLSAKVTKIEGTKVFFTDKKDAEQSVEADKILVATGRAVNTAEIGLESIGVDFDRAGIKVNDKAQTNVPNVYAAGDVTGRWQLAHFASRQATVAISNMFGKTEYCREKAIPSVVYTDPEIACVGLTEEKAEEKGISIKTAKMPLNINGRFLAETDGERCVCKLIVGAEHGEILGLHLIGPHASEMIAAAAVAIESELRVDEWKEVVFPHPAICEVMHDVAFHVK
jgi:dihydrolipoamide dehydrogenase